MNRPTGKPYKITMYTVGHWKDGVMNDEYLFWGNLRIGLKAKTRLNRTDYGINYHQVLEMGVLAVGVEVEPAINAEAVKETVSQHGSETR